MNQTRAVIAQRTQTVNKSLEFSKLILIFETLLVAYTTWRVLGFVDDAIEQSFTGSLPYLTALITAVWGAYGTSISFYYNKTKAENTEKIKSAATVPNTDRDN